jgi:hypothetical protein
MMNQRGFDINTSIGHIIKMLAFESWFNLVQFPIVIQMFITKGIMTLDSIVESIS